MKLFVFILLATLSIVNAVPFQLHKRALTFDKCPIDSASPLTVTATPDPLVPGEASKFDISGKLAAPPSKGSNLVVVFFDPAKQAPVGTPITTDICPLTADCTATDFTTTLDVPVPADLPATFAAIVAIANTAEENISACSFAKVGDFDLAAASIPPL